MAGLKGLGLKKRWVFVALGVEGVCLSFRMWGLGQGFGKGVCKGLR